MPRLNDYYKETVFPSLKEKFGYKNIHQIPGLEKIVVSMGVGSAVETKSRMDVAVKDLGKITGQKPAIKVARKSVANFRLRAGSPVGCMVTLRNERMYEFFDRLVSVVLPRIRDFRGMKDKFDGQGNYSLGLSEQSLFPEIELDKVEFTQGMNVTIVTSARTDEEGRALLDGFGFPFRRKEDK
ncbi:MAG TPA: 50S ribosomal protein L5 [Planctomycetota bacterium]|jgi:large subunit ribosomal protein L5|nr:50S ribosomal protein L5 [Planctomycetota bacterium]MDP6128940.1 50S ribosomal protein L5 [Planctomycetota bacterium]MDP7246001.1 50S ribosomal protein L5 [Planctomycetota bacterium]HJM38955.1 50S ribosomal protein L5 [Planctomycetota bacterium]|tara:strand:- start:7761 stop:8309 length:549 start_codon:yes stop_codon:yes gene_type:complete